MSCQSRMNEYANDAVAALVRDYPDATLTDIINGLHDAISDAPAIYTEADRDWNDAFIAKFGQEAADVSAQP